MRNMFRRGQRFNGGDLETATRVIRHLQKALAYQQLSMELFNDATAAVMGAPTSTSEIVHAEYVADVSPRQVQDVLLPALDEKVRCLDLMGAEFEKARAVTSAGSASNRTRDTLQSTCAAFVDSVRTSRARADLQRSSYRGFVERPGSVQEDPTALDAAEATAVMKAVQKLQSVLQSADIDLDSLVALNHEVTNEIRTSRQQAPLTLEDYGSRYMVGITGGRARFFNDD